MNRVARKRTFHEVETALNELETCTSADTYDDAEYIINPDRTKVLIQRINALSSHLVAFAELCVNVITTKQNVIEKCTIYSFPKDVLCHIFSFCKNMIHARQVCKRWLNWYTHVQPTCIKINPDKIFQLGRTFSGNKNSPYFVSEELVRPHILVKELAFTEMMEVVVPITEMHASISNKYYKWLIRYLSLRESERCRKLTFTLHSHTKHDLSVLKLPKTIGLSYPVRSINVVLIPLLNGHNVEHAVCSFPSAFVYRLACCMESFVNWQKLTGITIQSSDEVYKNIAKITDMRMVDAEFKTLEEQCTRVRISTIHMQKSLYVLLDQKFGGLFKRCLDGMPCGRPSIFLDGALLEKVFL